MFEPIRGDLDKVEREFVRHLESHAALFPSVIEFIHTATLVHDDIIDESEMRRGRQAVHSRWGNDVTVRLGDFLYIKSMSMALSRDSLDFIRLLCEVTLRR